MSSSYEKGIYSNDYKPDDQNIPLDIPLLKFLWQSNPFVGGRKDVVPKFLKEVKIFSTFTDFELHKLCQYLHLRTFNPKELIFDQGEPGIGFYLIYSGHVEIVAKDSIEDMSMKDLTPSDFNTPERERHIILLERLDYFGEMSIIQEQSFRTACAVAKDDVKLLSIFKPDIDRMIEGHPVVAAKFLQSVAMVVANRFSSLTKEMKFMKYKLAKFEDGTSGS